MSNVSKSQEYNKFTRKIAFVHHKGGTGKTSSCLNVAGWLSKMKKKVLVIDLDPQGNATAGLCVDRQTTRSSVYDMLLGTRSAKEVILQTDIGVFLMPSSLDLLAAEKIMSSQMKNSHILKRCLEDIQNYFDYILIDVPPGATLLMINGMVAAGNIIIPLDSGVFAYEALNTLKTIVMELARELGVEINIVMVLIREYGTSVFEKGPTRNIKKLVKKYLEINAMPCVKIFPVPFSMNIYRAQMKGRPISHHSPYSGIGRFYKKLTKEILSNNTLDIFAA